MEYKLGEPLSTGQFIDLLHRSSLAERRPVEDPECIAGMLHHADLTVTAWEKGLLVGVARSVTDFHYCCYLSDLAVDRAYQRQGIGRQLVLKTREQLEPSCTLILLAAPAAQDYYPRLGFARHDSAWVLHPDDPLR